MKTIFDWCREHDFPVQVAIFLALILPSAGLYLAAKRGDSWSVWLLLGVVVLANLLAMFSS